MITLYRSRILVGLLLGALTGCSSGPGLDQAGRLRFVHGLADLPGVTLYRDCVPLTPLTPNGATLAPLAASQEIQVNPDRAHYTGVVTGQRLFDLPLRLDAYPRLVVLAAPAVPTDPLSVDVLDYRYDDELPATSNETGAVSVGLRFLNLSSLPAVSLLVITPDNLIRPIVDNAAPGEVSGLDDGISRPLPLAFSSGEYHLVVRAGTDEPIVSVDHTFTPGEVLNLALIIRSSGPGLLLF